MILTLFVIIGVLVAGIMNYLIRRTINKKAGDISWFSPENLVEINGIKTHIIVRGEGDPLLFIHGSQMNLYDFNRNIDFFSKHFKVYAFDMVGCGFSDKPKADYSPQYFSDFINYVMLHYHIDKASFVASSWGGGHVFHFALNYPEKVNKLVMSSPCGFKHEMMSSYNILSIPVLGKLALLFNSKSLVRSELCKAFHDKSLVDEELVRSVYIPFYTHGCINSTVKSARNDDFSFVQNNLEKIDAPVLLIWGSCDKIHPKWMMDEMQNRLKNSHLCIIDNVGHLPHKEASNDFNKCTFEFLLNG